jgi:HSP20 family molecular chaperone IbpA
MQMVVSLFVVEAAVAGIDASNREFERSCTAVTPTEVPLIVTPTEVVLAAPVHHSDREQEGEVLLCEFANGPLFRSYRFPEPVDPARVSAEYRNGLLRLTAPLAQRVTKVEVQAA